MSAEASEAVAARADAPGGASRTVAGPTGPRAVDPFAAPSARRRGFLYGLNALAKLAATVPVMVALVFTRGIPVPLAFVVLGLALLVTGARLGGRWLSILFIGVPLAAAVLGVSFGVWIDPATVAGDPGDDVVLFSLGDWSFTLAMYLVGLATALRITALIVLSLASGLTTTGPELVRALVQNLRVPYRIGYTALAALRFVPRFGHELEVIRAAHRVRGTDPGRGPVAAVRRTVATAVPLLAGAIRHAERVALAMDARAFGAHPTRTERTVSRWRVRDTVFVCAYWLAAAAVFVLIPVLMPPV